MRLAHSFCCAQGRLSGARIIARLDYAFGHYVCCLGDVNLLLFDPLPASHLNVSSKYLYKSIRSGDS